MPFLQAPPRVRSRVKLTVTASRIKTSLLFISVTISLSLLLYINHLHRLLSSPWPPSSPPPAPPLPLRSVLFSVASSSASLSTRASYIRLWHAPISHLNTTFVFVNDRPAINPTSLPPIIVQNTTTSSFSAAKRIAHIVKDAFALDVPGIHWYVFGDDDTVFFPDNVAKILSKYDHDEWYYIGGSGSESYEQNHKFYFDMAFGGGGYAISAPLVRAMSNVLDDCLERYGHLFGSDVMVYGCLSELGVPLTVERGFHQVDLRGDVFGMLSSHPLSLVASLHHFDAIETIFPNMSRLEALEHLFKAVHVDPARTLQQTVCYDSNNTLTFSVSWGHAVQVYEGSHLLPDLLSLQRTFKPWKRGKTAEASARFMFKTRGFPRDPCKRSLTFYLSDVVADENGVRSKYYRNDTDECSRSKAIENLEVVSVFSPRPDLNVQPVKTLRRQCCDLSPFRAEEMIIHMRKCRIDELIAMKEQMTTTMPRRKGPIPRIRKERRK